MGLGQHSLYTKIKKNPQPVCIRGEGKNRINSYHGIHWSASPMWCSGAFGQASNSEVKGLDKPRNRGFSDEFGKPEDALKCFVQIRCVYCVKSRRVLHKEKQD